MAVQNTTRIVRVGALNKFKQMLDNIFVKKTDIPTISTSEIDTLLAD